MTSTSTVDASCTSDMAASLRNRKSTFKYEGILHVSFAANAPYLMGSMALVCCWDLGNAAAKISVLPRVPPANTTRTVFFASSLSLPHTREPDRKSIARSRAKGALFEDKHPPIPDKNAIYLSSAVGGRGGCGVPAVASECKHQ